MQLNSYVFVLVFLPLMVLAFFTLGKINKWMGKVVLIIGSIIFYGYSDSSALVILGISLAINLCFVKLIEGSEWKKLFMAIPVIINVGLLCYFKYTNFAIININALLGSGFALKELALPVGISFFTFQQIAYIVAVYRREIASVSVMDYIAYILYFPKLLMGPLMEPVDFLEQLNDEKINKIDWNHIAYGAKIFSLGLLKKGLFADAFAQVVSWAFTNLGATSMDWLLAMLAYTFEIYFDFSGYSDMAVGASMMFNITLPINFDSPYKAVSIRDFWKRWHVSLTKFLTKYIYIPLGGSKKGFLFTCVNTMIVFLISGIWHGANWTFILWGLLHGAFSVFDRLLEKTQINIFEPVRWLATFLAVNVLWLLFRADSVQQWLDILQMIKGFYNTSASADLLEIFPVSMPVFMMASFAICVVPENNYRNLKKLSAVSMVLAALALAWGIICLGRESVFVYYNF